MSRNPLAAGILVFSVVSPQWLSQHAVAQITDPPCPSADAVVDVSDLPSNFNDSGCPAWSTVTLADASGVSIDMPTTGSATYLEELTDEGEELLGVDHALDGTISISGQGDELDGVSDPATGANSPSACSDAVYRLEPWHVASTSPYRWFYNPANTPSNIGTSTAATVFQAAVNGVTNTNTDCTVIHHPAVPAATYLGTTNVSPGTPGDYVSNCPANDGVNVVGFKHATTSTSRIGLTCAYTTGGANGTLVNADVSLNNGHAFFTGTVPTGCSSRWDMHGTAMHEFGHVFGAAHPSEDYTHMYLTMSTALWSCTTIYRTLGLGDVNALDARYN